MASINYEELAASIPEEWFDKEELQQVIRTVFTKLVDGIAERLKLKVENEDELDEFYKAISAKSGEATEKIEENFVSDSSVFGRLEHFEKCFPKIIEQLPKNSKGNIVYPIVVLGRVLGVDNKLAEEMSKFYFGEPDPAIEDKKAIN